MRCSICIATYGRPEVLDKVLQSIRRQSVPWLYEVIVVDDGGDPSAEFLCMNNGVRYTRIERDGGYRNPSAARNVAYRMAQGDVLICQSDDVVHEMGVIERLVDDLHEGEFLLATVWNVDQQGRKVGCRQWPNVVQLTGLQNRRPLFFLGSLWRRDMYAIGGSDEEFTEPGWEDNWFADCLINGQRLKPRYLETAVGYHQDHDRPQNLRDRYARSSSLYLRKVADARCNPTLWRGGQSWPL